jgi:phospholipid/cholesterol/gamma-HCH transport system substrate-binding protein
MTESAPMRSERRLIIRTGLFVSGALVLAGVVIFLIGRENRLFERHVRYHAAFENVEGLKLDSPVRLGGLDVGRIKSISFSPDIEDRRIDVTMEISSRFANRVRADSVARIGSRGVLGDKVIEISLGSVNAAQIAEGGEIKTGSSGDITSLLKAGGELLDNAVAISRDVRAAVSIYTEPALRQDVAGLIRNLRQITAAVDSGKGLLHALIYDTQATADGKRLLAAAARDAERFDAAISQVEGILREVRSGSGTLHALVYERAGMKAVSELGDAAGELAKMLRGAQENRNSAVHQLFYGDSGNLFGDLSAAAADLRVIMATIRNGEGSLGALINDPTVYEDLRTVLGNVKRNFILRELVRYSISHRGELEQVGKPAETKK